MYFHQLFFHMHIYMAQQLCSYLLSDIKTYIHTKTCIQMFIAALLIITKTWKLPTRGVNQELWYVLRREYCSVIKGMSY